MKLTLIAVASTVFTLSLSALAEDMSGMKMDGMEGMLRNCMELTTHLHCH